MPDLARGLHPVAERQGVPRVRVVLGEVARQRVGSVPARSDLAEQTGIADVLVRGLVRAQLALAVRLALVVAIGLGGLPLLFAVAPAVTEVRVAGVNLPWLLLGVAAYPFLLAAGWAYVHLAERNEQDFTAVVRRRDR